MDEEVEVVVDNVFLGPWDTAGQCIHIIQEQELRRIERYESFVSL